MYRNAPSTRADRHDHGARAPVAVCVALLAMRPAVAGGFDHLDLTWNMVLAWVPFVVALVVYDRAKRGAGGAELVALLGVWLVFFPNAPYIVTDLVYLQIWTREPLWYDEMTSVVFAVTG